ncbi:RHS repeat-associated core domain-containing protein [Maridesulfovibrio frigidus]|uniref:RHS repeat-associated core domain-containing protein n=1 Tax=Maridesulfovibrio frigidus TaxID=340956 RepID=UPI0004E15363|nr:RHS repeat-associated core domain-containing protein [Maridesulfovibrio frigidus]
MRGSPFSGYRDYDPTIGRFTTPDPIGLAGGDVDVYGYCLDDPTNFHDRTGLAGQSQESKDELADTVINELISTKAPSVTANEEYKKGNVEGSGIPKSGQAPKSTKSAGDDRSDVDASKEKIANDKQNADKEEVNSPKAEKSKLTLRQLGIAAAKWGLSGAAIGAPVGMLYEVGSKAIADTLGIDEETQEYLREAMGNIISKKEKRD